MAKKKCTVCEKRREFTQKIEDTIICESCLMYFRLEEAIQGIQKEKMLQIYRLVKKYEGTCQNHEAS